MPEQVPAPSTAEPVANIPNRYSRQRIITAIICLTPSFLLMLSAFVPLVRATEDNDLDWLPLVNEAHARGLAWGRDIVFTYGPWGFLWSGYDPRTFVQLCLFWSIAAGITWWGLYRLVTERFGRSILMVGLVLLSLALALGGDYTCSPDARLMIFPVLLLLCHFFVSSNPFDAAKFALVGLIAFTGLIKFPYLVAGSATVLLICLDPLAPLRRRWLPLLVYGLTFILGWLIAGQRIGDLPNHLRYSLELTRGYSEALSRQTAIGRSQIGPYLAINALLFAMIAFTAIRCLRFRSVLFLAGMMALLFIAFRSGFVRHDLHEVIATSLTLNTALLACVAGWSQVRGWLVRLMWGICVVSALVMASKTIQDWYGDSLLDELSHTLAGVAVETAETGRLLGGRSSSNFHQWQQNMAGIITRVPIPAVQGTVDLYPKDSVILLANKLDYHPRPTLQSYVAYTPVLARLNADRLAGPDAPDNILFRIDFRTHDLAAAIDNYSWLQILCGYQMADAVGDYARLVKRKVPLKATFTLLIDTSLPLGTLTHLKWSQEQSPPKMVWAKIQLERRPFGTLMSEIYRSPLVVFSVRTANGQENFARLVPAIAAEGFLLGPFVVDNATFRLLAAPNPAPQTWQPLMPESIMVSGVGGSDISWYFQNSAHITLYGLTLDAN